MRWSESGANEFVVCAKILDTKNNGGEQILLLRWQMTFAYANALSEAHRSLYGGSDARLVCVSSAMLARTYARRICQKERGVTKKNKKNSRTSTS